MGKRDAEGDPAETGSLSGNTTVPKTLARISLPDICGLPMASAVLAAAASGISAIDTGAEVLAVDLRTGTVVGRISGEVIGIVGLPGGTDGFAVVDGTVVSIVPPGAPAIASVDLGENAAQLERAVAVHNIVALCSGTDAIVLFSSGASTAWSAPAPIAGVVPGKGGVPVFVVSDGTCWSLCPEPCQLALTVDNPASVVTVDPVSGVVVSGSAESESGVVLLSHRYPFSDLTLFGTVVAAAWEQHSVSVLVDEGGSPVVYTVMPPGGMTTGILVPDEISFPVSETRSRPVSSISGRFVLWKSAAYMVA